MRIKHTLLGMGLLGAALTVIVGTAGWWGLHALGRDIDETVVATLDGVWIGTVTK